MKTSLILWFKCNNQNQNSSNDENNPMMKMQTIFLMRMKEFQKSPFFHSDVEDMAHVGEIALTKAYDPVHFFYLFYITKEQGSITKIVKDDYGHKYHPGSKIICEKYLEIFKDGKTLTK